MPKFERLSEADVNRYKAWQVLDNAREKLKAPAFACGLRPESLVIQARTQDGLLVRTGEDKAEILRHHTPYGDLILDRKRGLAQSPLRPGVNIRLSRNSGLILAKLLNNPEACVSETELHKTQYPQETIFTPNDSIAIKTAISRLRSLLGDRFNPPTQTWQLVFTFSGDEQTYYSLTPYLPNKRLLEEQEIDAQRYIYRYEVPFIGELVLYADRGIAQSPLRPGQDIGLTPLETRLLVVLMSDPKRVFSHQFLIQEVWRGRSPGSFSDQKEKFSGHMRYLRAKLGDAEPRRIIRTFKNFGYSLTDPKDPSVGARL